MFSTSTSYQYCAFCNSPTPGDYVPNRRSSALCGKFVELATRYLGIRSTCAPEKRPNFTDRNETEGTDGENQVCENCFPALELFCRLHHQWFSLQLEIRQCLEQIAERVEKCPRGVSKGDTSNHARRPDSLADFRSKFLTKVEKIRKNSKNDFQESTLNKFRLDMLAKEVSACSGSVIVEYLPATKVKMVEDSDIKVEPSEDSQNDDDSVSAEREILSIQEHEVVSDSPATSYNAAVVAESNDNAVPKRKLRRHKKIVRNIRKKPFECSVCFKDFINRRKMNTHLLTHTSGKNITTGNRLARRDNLKPRKRRGIVCDSGFLCGFCGKQFKYQRWFEQHEAWCQKVSTEVPRPENSSEVEGSHNKRSKGGLEQLKCPFCKGLYTTKYFSKHLERHNYNPDFDCIMCKKTCRGKTELNFHLLSHIGERPWFCRYCDASFMTRGVRKGHEKAHKGFKPFQCSVCLKRFIVRTKLNNHMRTHTGEKPYMCGACGRRFAVQYKMKQHYDKLHQPK